MMVLDAAESRLPATRCFLFVALEEEDLVKHDAVDNGIC